MIAAVGARLLLAVLLPPLLDVYYYDVQAVQALSNGHDPYGYTYSGIPAWLSTPGAANVLPYLPAVVLFLAPFGLFWDVRLGLIVADLIIAWGILALGRRWSGKLALVFLLAPFAMLFSTSYPNNTLVGMAFLGLAVAADVKGKTSLSAVMLGVSLAASQFIWLLYPFFLYLLVRARGFKEIAVSLAVAAAIVLPFFLADPSDFVYDTVFFEFTRVPRTLVTPVAFGLNVNPTLSGLAATFLGVGVPLILRASITLTAMTLALFRSRDRTSMLGNMSWFMLVVVFVLPNDFSWWYLEVPFQTFLIWLALSRGELLADRAKALANP